MKNVSEFHIYKMTIFTRKDEGDLRLKIIAEQIYGQKFFQNCAKKWIWQTFPLPYI